MNGQREGQDDRSRMGDRDSGELGCLCACELLLGFLFVHLENADDQREGKWRGEREVWSAQLPGPTSWRRG